jgi:GDP-L-fucose synthase
MEKGDKIYVAGHTGLVGSALKRSLKSMGYDNLVYRELSELDLRSQADVNSFFEKEKPDHVFLAAARVGGIYANNTYRADFIYDNLMIESNIIHAAYINNVKKLLFLGSTCIYPREAPQPMPEDSLLTSPLEYTNEPYAIAKIAGIKMCESFNLQYGTNFLSVMPTNLYGPGDNFNLLNSHVLPALLRKIHLAKCLEEKDMEALIKDFSIGPQPGLENLREEDEILNALKQFGIIQKDGKITVEIWGTGKPMREFLWIDDMADACVFVMENIDFSDIIKEKGLSDEVRNTHINIGTGVDITIKELAEKIKEITGFRGDLFFNPSKPDGTPRKLIDVSLIHRLGWQHQTDLEEGLVKLYNWYKNQ